ncbi:MAG: ABC transporter permease [Clostridia bacterium]|nr:ABC transporter permease [Clostridia bacterium]
MKNPLHKRLLRDLRSEIGKYLVIFLLLMGSIGIVSGFLVADGSMITAYNESFEKYNIEDGNFRLSRQANKAQIKAIESLGITLYDNFYVEKELTNGSTLRIFQNRDEVNRVCLMEGEMPKALGEIAIDRMYADNNGIQIGDTLADSKQSWTVTGLVALSDYSCLFSDNNDSMFDAVKFGVSVVTEDEFAGFDASELHYSYAWKYDTAPVDETEEKERSEDLMKDISAEVTLESFVPQYLNQAIRFTGDDMGSDRAMMIALLYIIILIMAFVFGITVSNTIMKEANVIGTLRASGYTRSELIRHYMTMPVLVTGAGAVLGNILGYTIFKNICADLYYGSYSLPTYVTIWNAEAFLLTTVVPLVLMAVINFIVLWRKLMLSPLRFLRRDISRKKQRRAVRLSSHIPFFSRFRLRIIFQNTSNYCILFVGILFANLLLMFGMLFPSVLAHYQEEMEDNMLCEYQYMLQVPLNAMNEDNKLESLLSMLQFQYAVETENEDAEKFSAYSLQTLGEQYKSEEIVFYGVDKDSKYISIDVDGADIVISAAYAEKYNITPGDSIVLKEAYEDTEYTFYVAGVYDYSGALAVFMNQEDLNGIFDLDDGYFSGYFSDTEITDIDEQYIASVIDLETLTKISRQLSVSMGSMMYIVDGFAMIMFMILIYLLSKIIIEKNAQSISMTKILGYTNGEISRLYIVSTSIMVVLFLLISLPIEYEIMALLFRMIMLSSMTGWITFYVDAFIFIKMFLMGIATYAVVAAMEYRKIQRVPMDEALKNVE